jgi:hypothetical protein
MFYKIIGPFIDPVTRTKMKFNEPLSEHVPVSQLQKRYGGEADFFYEHEVYWPSLNALIEARRKQYKDRWIARGQKIGDEEWVLRGGEETKEVASQNPEL